MYYILYNQIYPLLKININMQPKQSGGNVPVIEEISTIYDDLRLPVGIKNSGGKIEIHLLNSWFQNRKIPASRQHLDILLKRLNVSAPEELILKNYGLSLSDQYWFCPEQKVNFLKWQNINYFDNDFSDTDGKSLDISNSIFSFSSLKTPNNTSDGWLQKIWKIKDGDRYLIKGGSSPFYQEPINEVFATEIAKKMGFLYVPYYALAQNNGFYSVCPNFITRDTELVPAWHIINSRKKPNHMSSYDWYKFLCEEKHVLGAKQDLDNMLVLDYLIANTDRHYHNFGLIRNVDTAEYISAAPIFDSGTSLFHDQLEYLITDSADIPSKPFRSTHEKQIELVDLKTYDFDLLSGIELELENIFLKNPILANYDNRTMRLEKLKDFILARIEKIKKLQRKQLSKYLFSDKVRTYDEATKSKPRDYKRNELER